MNLTPRSHAYEFGPTRFADHYIYRCYDTDGALLYIGCTHNPKAWLTAHRRGSGAKASRWLSVCMERYEVEGPYRGRDIAREVEHTSIQSEQPLFNYQCRTNVGIAAWATRRPIAIYLVEHGHIELALETVCLCWRETREAHQYDPWCYAHEAAQVAGLTELQERAA